MCKPQHVKRLTQEHQRVCVVGDDAQSIYSFRGRIASAHSGRRKAFERQKQELLSDIDAGRIRIEPPRH